jgi:hypothetical protein
MKSSFLGEPDYESEYDRNERAHGPFKEAKETNRGRRERERERERLATLSV